jgi:FAD/FMN-containing dehydrogenase
VALVGVADVRAALEVLGSVRPALGAALTAAELMTADGLALVRAHAGLPAPMAGDHPAYLLLECADPAAGADPAEALAAAVDACPGVRDAVVADDPRRRAELWRYREDHSEALGAAGRVLKLDVCLPPASLAGFVEALPGLVTRAVGSSGAGSGQVRAIVFGHLAEGNLHVNVLDAPAERSEAVTDAVLRTVAAAGGSISAEHGVGRAKVRWLHLSRSAADLAAMAAIKQALDPGGLLAPGVLLPPPDHPASTNP